MSLSQGFTKLEAKPLFHNKVFAEVDQLADILFSDFEQAVQLTADHEAIITCWITSSMHNARLVREVSLPIAVYQFSLNDYLALAPEVQTSLMHRQHTWLYFKPGLLVRASQINQKRLQQLNTHKLDTKTIDNHTLSALIGNEQTLAFPDLASEHAIKLLKYLLGQLYHPTQVNIPEYCIKQALYWQSLYAQKSQVLAKTVTLIRRAISRLLAKESGGGQVVLLEPYHIAEVLSDWEQIALAEILRPNDDSDGMSQYLHTHVLAQDMALTKAVNQYHKQKARVFILAGPRYCGRRTFAKFFTKFINGHERFCLEIDFNWLHDQQVWHDIRLKSPLTDGQYLSIADIVQRFPQVVFLLTHIKQEQSDNSDSIVLRDFMRCAYFGSSVINETVVDFSQVTWLVLLDHATPSKMSNTLMQAGGSDFESATEQQLSAIAGFDEQSGQVAEFVAETELGGLEDIIYEKSSEQIIQERAQQAELDDQWFSEKIFALLPHYFAQNSVVLPFMPLSVAAKKLIITQALKSTVRHLRMQWKFPLYFQEEVTEYLYKFIAAQEDGLTLLPKLLHDRVNAVYQHAFKTIRLEARQAFMLQLNETGTLLVAAVVEQPSVLQNRRASDFIKHTR